MIFDHHTLPAAVLLFHDIAANPLVALVPMLAGNKTDGRAGGGAFINDAPTRRLSGPDAVGRILAFRARNAQKH